MSRVAIIADDLSSATDCGVAFARRGMRTLVPLGSLGDLRGLPFDADVLSLDADSRVLSPREAYEEIARAASALRGAGSVGEVYKSIDSTLRGNLGAEIDAAIDVFEADLAVVAPAFPLHGRTTVGGRHFLHGVPMDRTEMARDPACPVKESDLVALLSSQSKRRVGLVDLGTLRAGGEAVWRRVDKLLMDRIELVVFDVETEDDLRRIAEVVAGSGRQVVWAGSTGLARHLPGVLASPVEYREPFAAPSSPKPALLVSGSLSAVTREQIAVLRRSGAVGVEVDPERIVVEEGVRQEEGTRCRTAAEEALDHGEDLALHVASSPEKRAAAEEAARKAGLDGSEVATRITGALGWIASEVVTGRDLAGLVLTGGDTAKAICQQLGGSGVELLDEVEAGVPLCRLVKSDDSRHHGLPVVTKAGAFGDGETLVRAFRVLKGA
jgi:uncharacterized protein YgbK (DUF1537 family)